MKILITGAAGFIGLNLVKFFLSKDYTVIGIDNFSNSSSNNIESFYSTLSYDLKKKFIFFNEDLQSIDFKKKNIFRY